MDSDDEQDTRIEELLQLHPALLMLKDSGRVSVHNFFNLTYPGHQNEIHSILKING